MGAAAHLTRLNAGLLHCPRRIRDHRGHRRWLPKFGCDERPAALPAVDQALLLLSVSSRKTGSCCPGLNLPS